MTVKKYLLLHLALTLLVCIGAFFLVRTMYGAEFLWLTYLAIALTSLPSLLVFVLVSRGLQKPFKFFLSFVVGGMFMKMLIGIIAMVSIGVYGERDQLFFFAVTFMLGYLVFTSLEVTSLMRKNREVQIAAEEEKKISDNQDKNS